MRRSSGFTLVEMLVALTLFSIISVSIYSVFSSGLHTWRVGSRWSEDDQGARIFFGMIGRELENAVNYAPEWPFEGKERKLAFMTLLEVHKEDGNIQRELSRVSYTYDPKKKRLVRSLAGKDEGFDTSQSKDVTVIENLERADFRYAYEPVYESEGYRWKKEWGLDKEIPRGVRIQLGDLSATIFMPMGLLGNEKED